MNIQKRILKKARKGISRGRLTQKERDALDYLVEKKLINSRCDIAKDFYLISEEGRFYLATVFKDNARYNVTTGISILALVLSAIALAVSLRPLLVG